MDIYKAKRICSTISGIPRFKKKNIKSGHYEEILHKEGKHTIMQRQDNNTFHEKSDNGTFKDAKNKNEDSMEESNLTSFEDDNYRNNHKQ